MIVLTALIGIKIINIPLMAFVAATLAISMIIITIFGKGKGVGGADIKPSVVCGFLLRIEKGIVGLIIGLIFSIITNLIIQGDEKKAYSFPLIPYLAVEFMADYFVLREVFR